MGKLKAKTVSAISEPGKHYDGEGLYLHVGANGGKSWILRTVVHGKRREIGLGGASTVSLAEARELARTYRKVARDGGDPIAARDRKPLTFEEAAREVHKEQCKTFRNPKHAALWLSSLEAYAFPKIGARPIETVKRPDVVDVLSPIWTTKHDTARRVKQRIATVFNWAIGKGHYTHPQPVDDGLLKALPKVSAAAEHMAALPWPKVPAFMADLAEREAITAACLSFLILTAARSGEARGARWSEIDLEAGTWTIPKERMKAKAEHRVPLAPAAVDILKRLQGLDPVLVFPAPQRGPRGAGKELSVNAFRPLLDRMDWKGFTVHGFRSAFRDWCSESAKADREVAEAALAHTVGNAVERAYSRSDLFERRRALMEAWARFATGETGKIVELVRA